MGRGISAGFHLSIAGGVWNAPSYALGRGYKAFQLFTTSSRTWGVKKIAQDAAERFRALSAGMEAFAHNSYLCNPSSPNEEVYTKSEVALAENMRNCNALGIKSLVIHIGSHMGRGEEYGIGRAVEMLKHVIDKVPSTRILLENSPGYTNSVGSKMSAIGRIIDGVGSGRLGVCIDTCHAFAAGYDMRSAEGVDELASGIEEHIGGKNLGLVHLNDAKFGLGSGRDRHWHIGWGEIGARGFANLFSNELFRKGCFVMEVPPGSDGMDWDRDMRALTKIAGSCGLEVNR